MPAIVEFPTIVEQAVREFGDLFRNEPERRHFAEYLTGLLVAERKTVAGINAEFAVTTDQSCLNRWLTDAPWDVAALNERRLQWLQRDPTTHYAAQGVIPIDNTLVDHSGELIEDVGWFWDHAEQRYKIAHDYLIVNYVCPSGKHYPLEFRRFRARTTLDQVRQELQQLGWSEAEIASVTEFKSHTELCCELIDWVVEHETPGDFTFDCYFTNAAVLNHIDQHRRGYVGGLKFNREVRFQGQELSACEVAKLIPAEARKPVQLGDNKQWYFTKTVTMAEVKQPVRLVILWDRKNGAEPVKLLVTNRTYWEVSRILRVYRRRWTGTETFHRDARAAIGPGRLSVAHRRGADPPPLPGDADALSARGIVTAGARA